MCAQDYPQKNVRQTAIGAISQDAAGGQPRGGYVPSFLRIIAAMAQREGGGGKQLTFPKDLVYPAGRGAMKNPVNRRHQTKPQNRSDQRREHNELKRSYPDFSFQ